MITTTKSHKGGEIPMIFGYSSRTATGTVSMFWLPTKTFAEDLEAFKIGS